MSDNDRAIEPRRQPDGREDSPTREIYIVMQSSEFGDIQLGRFATLELAQQAYINHAQPDGYHRAWEYYEADEREGEQWICRNGFLEPFGVVMRVK